MDLLGGYAIVYTLLIVPVWFLYFHCKIGVAQAIEFGGKAFSRTSVLGTASIFPIIAKAPLKLWRVWVEVAASLGFVIAPYFAESGFLWDQAYTGAAIGLSISFILSAIHEKAVYPLLCIAPLGLAAGLAVWLSMYGVVLSEARSDVERLGVEQRELVLSSNQPSGSDVRR